MNQPNRIFIVRDTIGVKGKDFKNIIVAYPEMILQHRRHILLEKFMVITKNTSTSRYYLKDMFIRHPELFLKSYASFKAKLKFLLVEMGRNLKAEPCFPLILKFNLNAHIKPR